MSRVCVEVIDNVEVTYGWPTSELIEAIKSAEKKALDLGGQDLYWYCDGYEEYGDSFGRLCLRYARPKTDAELAKQESWRKQREEYERRQYEALKKKFENNS